MKFTTFWKKGWVFYPNYFRNYFFGNKLLLKRLEGLALEHHSEINVLTGSKLQLKVARHHYYPFFPWILGKLSWKKTALLWSKILRLFANTLTADDKYSCGNMQNFRQQFQTLLSEKQKTFSGFFIAFLKCGLNLEHFEKKNECPSLILPEIIVSERGCYWNV